VNSKIFIDKSKCTLCGKCVEVCNDSGLRMVGREMTSGEVLHEVMADFDFYKKSGGGMTLSGGEPMLQFDFSMEILKKCKELGVNTCVETSGEITSQKFSQIMPFVDIFLFDYKVTGLADHKRYTGVSNERILKNLDTAYHFAVPIILRCPIIPGVNDNELHFRAICDMDKKYPKLKGIEILPYHTMGNSKRISIGLDETLAELKTVSSEVAEKWVEQLKSYGCHKAKIG